MLYNISHPLISMAQNIWQTLNCRFVWLEQFWQTYQNSDMVNNGLNLLNIGYKKSLKINFDAQIISNSDPFLEAGPRYSAVKGIQWSDSIAIHKLYIYDKHRIIAYLMHFQYFIGQIGK